MAQCETYLALDLGTTNWKAGLFTQGKKPILRKMPIVSYIDAEGQSVYDPDVLWESVQTLIGQLPQEQVQHVIGVGIAGMAEAGLLLDRASGKPLTPILPWSYQVKTIQDVRVGDRFFETGLPQHSKYSLYKILLYAEHLDTSRLWWLGVPEYIAWRMTGVRQTEPTLAARTYVYRVQEHQWDSELLHSLGVDRELFPSVGSTGQAIGTAAHCAGLPKEATVAVCGHDHLAAAYALQGLSSDRVFISAGTAQVMLGKVPDRRLTECDKQSGISFGPCPEDGKGWIALGSIQSSGGSVTQWSQWLNLTMAQWWELVQEASTEPSTLIYLPYLAGSGAPHLDASACGALMGLRAEMTVQELVLGVVQGIAMETRWVIEHMGFSGRNIVMTGGMSRSDAFCQMLSNVLNVTVEVPDCEEATLVGAAMLASGKRWCAADHVRSFVPDTNHLAWNSAYQRYSETIRLISEIKKGMK